MKKLFFLLLFLTSIKAFSQDSQPIAPVTTVSPNFTFYYKIVGGDTLYYGYSNNKWTQFSRGAWVSKYFAAKSDSITKWVTRTQLNTGLSTKQNIITLGSTSQYIRGDLSLATLNTSVVPEGSNLYYTNSRGIGSVLTGFSSSPGTITSADNISSAINKLNGNIGALVTGVSSFNSRSGAVIPVAGDYSSLTETLTHKDLTSVTNTFPIFNQNTTGNAATVTTNANLTGPVTSIGNTTAIANGAITNAMLANSAVANLSGTNTGDQTIILLGDITGSGGGSFTTSYNNVVPSSKGGAGSINGLLKANGSGTTSLAVANTDYLNPSYTGFDSRYLGLHATADNSTLWNNRALNTAFITTTPSYFLTYDNTNSNYGVATLASIQTLLGLGSNAYTSTSYLPLTAGSGSPLTGNLNITTSGSPGVVFTNTASSNKQWELLGFDNRLIVAEVGVQNSMIFVPGGFVGIGYGADPTSGNLLGVNGNSYFNGTGTFTNTTSNKLTLSGGTTQNGLTLSTVSGGANGYYIFNGDGGLGNGYGIYDVVRSAMAFYISNSGSTTLNGNAIINGTGTFTGALSVNGGTQAFNSVFAVAQTYSSASGSNFPVNITATQTAATTGTLEGMDVTTYVAHSSGTVQVARSHQSIVNKSGAGILNQGEGYNAVLVSSGGVTTNFIGYRVSSPALSGGASITNNYSFKADAGAGILNIADGGVFGGNLTAVLPTYSSGTNLPVVYNSTNNRFETSSGSGITGSGTTNYLPKFTSSSAIGNSQLFDNGTFAGVGYTSDPIGGMKFGVNGNMVANGGLILNTGNIILSGTGAGGKITQYYNVGTAGYGVPAIYMAARQASQTASVANVNTPGAAFTVGSVDGSFIISANVLVTSSTIHNFSVICTYTDEGNTSRVLTLNLSQLTGTFITAITNGTGASAYEGVPVQIRAKAGTTITISTTGTFTNVTYNIEGIIQQIN